MVRTQVAQDQTDGRVIQGETKPKMHLEQDYVPMPFTIKEIRDAIPAHLFVRDTTKSMLYAAKDLTTVAAIFYCATFIDTLPSPALRVSAWIAYGIIQGTAVAGLWALGHALQISHLQHHKHVGTVTKDVTFVATRSDLGLSPLKKTTAHDKADVDQDHHEHEESIFAETPLYTITVLFFLLIVGFPLYLLINLGGHGAPHWVSHFRAVAPLYQPHHAKDIFYSNCGIAGMLSILTYLSMVYSLKTVALYYGMPYMVLNAYVSTFSYLQHHDPQVPFFRGETWNFQRGAAAAVDRSYGVILDHVSHHMGSTHICHHMFSQMPFYNAIEATKHLKAKLGKYYLYDDTPILQALYRNWRVCKFVEDEGSTSPNAGVDDLNTREKPEGLSSHQPTAMFAVPGFSVGSLVVEGSKEQLKKRKAETITTATTTTTTTTTTLTTSSSATATTSAAAVLPIAASTSNAPFSKKFKKDPVFEKKAPSEPKLGWGWIPEPVPLKERATWNQSTKALRKAKAEEERAKKAKAIEDKKQLVSSISGPGNAVELLLKGSVDLTDIAALGGKKNKGKTDQDVEMKDASEAGGEGPKKRNKRLERKIKRAAFIAAMEANNKTDTPEASVTTTATATEETTQDVSGEAADSTANEGEEDGLSLDGKKKKKPKILQAPAPKHPELAKLTNKEKRLLKQLQKKQQAEGIDLTAIVVQKQQQQPLNPSGKRLSGQSKSDEQTLDAFQAAAAAAEEKIMAELNPKSKKDKKAEKKAAAAAVKEENKDKAEVESAKPKEKKDKKDNNKTETAATKKQQQLAKEREKLLEALARTNSALEELQESLGDDGDDTSPLAKKDVKSAVQDKKKNKKDEAPTATKKEKKAAAAAPVPAPAAPAAKQPKLTKLQEQMKKTLAGGKFRFLNEQLYTTTGEEAFGLFQSKPELFDEYHEGFRSQVESWPQNPVDIFISQLKPMPKDTVIADLGCGDAQIAAELPKHNVLSFDLVAKNERVTACDIAHLPLEAESVDVAIFCLSLMGTDFLKFLKEAYRVLKPNGKLKISEVISRFTDVDAFVDALKALGFELKDSDSSNKMFIMFDFVKPDPAQAAGKKAKKGSKKQKVQEAAVDPSEVDLEALDGPSLLKPCIYKKR
ncbi:25S rRNA (adenine645-N1)-methyltransferase [Linnemannia zychae]|nr:25S rRNA (adenine645-N1)-methyltransferase [Linnemannia zychae]